MSSHIRFLHGIAGTGPVDLYLGPEVVFRGLGYGEATPHMLVPAGRNRIRAVSAGENGRELLRSGVIIPEQSIYTLVLDQMEGEPQLLPVEEPKLELPDNTGALRVGIFTTPEDHWEIWLRKENEEPELLFSEAGARETTEYVVLPEGDYSLEFRDSKGRTVTEALGIEIVPGRFYTVYLLGRSLPEEEDYPVISVQLWDANSSVPLCTREPR